MIALILAGTEDKKATNAVTLEIALTVMFYLGYEAASVWFVWRYASWAAFWYEWNDYESDEARITKEAEIRGYELWDEGNDIIPNEF